MPAERGRRRGVALAAVALLLVAVVGVIALSSGGGSEEDKASDDAGRSGTTNTDTQPAQTQTGERPAAEEPPAAPPRDDATPVSAVRAFYTRAADGNFDGAWRLAGPRFRQAFGSQAGLEDTLGSLRSIEFVRLDESARSGRTATLQVQTVAEHSDRTERCSGTLQAVRRGDGWRVEPLGLRCTRD